MISSKLHRRSDLLSADQVLILPPYTAVGTERSSLISECISSVLIVYLTLVAHNFLRGRHYSPPILTHPKTTSSSLIGSACNTGTASLLFPAVCIPRDCTPHATVPYMELFVSPCRLSPHSVVVFFIPVSVNVPADHICTTFATLYGELISQRPLLLHSVDVFFTSVTVNIFSLDLSSRLVI